MFDPQNIFVYCRTVTIQYLQGSPRKIPILCELVCSMPAQFPRAKLDGLWRCLCPSIEPARHGRRFHHQASHSSPGQNRPNATRSCPATIQSRLLSNNQNHNDFANPAGNTGGDRPLRAYKTSVSMLMQSTPPYNCLKRASIDTIYDALIKLRAEDGNLTKIAAFITHLIQSRRQTPNLRMYEALIQANASRPGSADAIIDLLEGMEDRSIIPSEFTCHAVLRVLVNHPDYLIREDVLRIMRDRWYEFSPHTHNDLLLGLLRDGQYELAMEKFDGHFAQGDFVPKFVFDVFIYKFAELGFFDDALRILHHRMRHFRWPYSQPSEAQWYYLLERASEDLEYKCVKYVWARQVAAGGVSHRDSGDTQRRLIPPDGVVENVLATAARYGDVKMAMEAIQILTGRGVKLRLCHYETLVETYVAAGELENAVLSLFIMTNASVEPRRSTTRPILRSLLEHPDLLDAAIAWLAPHLLEAVDGVKKMYDPPPAAFTVALEAVLQIRGMNGPHGALEMLKKAATDGRILLEADAFNAILRECLTVDSIKELEVLMRESRVPVNSDTLETFLMIYSEHGNYEYVQRWGLVAISPQARRNNLSISWDAMNKFIRRALDEEDQVAWKAVTYCRNHGIPLHSALIERARVLNAMLRDKGREQATNEKESKGKGAKE